VVVRAFYAEAPAVTGNLPPLPPISPPERAGALLLMGATLLVGLWPGLLLDFITPALNSPLMQPLWKGGTP
jgi:NADH-quinone oxidoreductase subunit M